MASSQSLVLAQDDAGDKWYFPRKEIEENSPSRRDGIDLKKETYFRKSYCSFLQELGMRLQVPQITIATATIFCHRFFLRRSHGKHDKRTIATACMFLAAKVEETPRPLRNVIVLSYEIIHKKDPQTVQRIFKQDGVYEEQIELIVQGEKLVLETLDFELSVNHPYKPLVEAIRKFKIADPSALAQVAWNFVNDGLRTSLCLQLKPRQIAAGAIFLAAKFLKIKLQWDGQKAWWQDFAVTPSQLEEISNQMLELYDQNGTPRSSHPKATGETEISTQARVLPSGENANHGTRPISPRPTTIDETNADDQYLGTSRASRCENFNDTDSKRLKAFKYKRDGEINNNQQPEQGRLIPHHDSEPRCQQEQENIGARTEIFAKKDAAVSQPSLEAIKKLIETKVKAALERRRKLGPDSSRKRVCMDEDELIEMQLENGIEF